jgi:low affinity Fe/Cu permease
MPVQQSKAVNHLMEKLATHSTIWAGSSWAFLVAALMVVIWLVTGPVCHYSDTWQLVMNTVSSIVKFLMVFLIQRSQNKESLAMQIKLNELIAAMKGASNRLIDVEDLGEDEVRRLHERYVKLAHEAQARRDPTAKLSIERVCADH